MKNKKVRIIIIIAAMLLLIDIVVTTLVACHMQKKSNSSSPSNPADKSTVSGDIGNSATEESNESTNGGGSEEATAAGNIEGPTNVDSPEEPTTSGGNNTGSGDHTASGSESGDGYEGIAGTGKYNYGEALQKSLIFYELQRVGYLPENVRCNWRGDACLKDGADVGLDLTGGWVDAGDNVKFNLPMAYSAAMLGWSIYEDYEAYRESGQLKYALDNIKWANDYFIKCHPEDEVYYYQVGDGNADHGFWGPVEVVEYKMNRPSYKVTASAPGSAVTGEAAASLAVCSILYKDIDRTYSELCLKHAKSLYAFADKYKSDSGYTAANGFYNSWSGFYDELSWAGAWLYIATEDRSYLDKACTYYSKAGQDFDWSMCWDDVHIGAAVLLSRLTGQATYSQAVEKHLDFWTTGTDGKRIKYTSKGLAWLDSWGSLRYASTAGYIAMVYADDTACSAAKKNTYTEFAESQINYILGDTGFSFMIGFGENYPQSPHHRTAQGSYADNMNEPARERHVLYGALVGGPDATDHYNDAVSDFTANEVACDYNAGFTGLLAKMYAKYHGKTLKNFGAVEEIDEKEFYVEAGVNASGTDFMELKALVYNMTGWPARAAHNAELRYFIDLSEVYDAGGSASGITVSTNYMKDATADGIKVWDEDNHIYYLSVKFDEGKFFPGGQEQYKKEIQVRMKSNNGTWDSNNDPSYEGMRAGSMVAGVKLALYENGRLVYGTEPPSGNNAGTSVIPGGDSGNGNGNGNGDSGNTEQPTQGPSGPGQDSAESGDLSVHMNYSDSSVGGIMTIRNSGNGTIDLKKLTIKYYFTNDGGVDLQFSCYHSAIQTAGGAYNALSGCNGSFATASGADTDTVCTISFSDNAQLAPGDELTVNYNVNHSDWSAFNIRNDYSAKSVENIVVSDGARVLFGKLPE